MKRDFLQNFKVGDTALPKEIIDAIMAENGRDIEAAKKPFADYETIKTQLEEAKKTITSLKEQDIEGVKKAAQDWEEKYKQAVKDHETQLANLAFDSTLKDAITAAKGRSAKAISAMLDIDALKKSKDQTKDISDALNKLKQESGYLFEDGEAPPPYAGGTGSGAAKTSDDDLVAAMRAAAGLKNNDERKTNT